LPLKTSDPCLDIFDVADDYLQHLTGNIRYTPILLVHHNRNQSYHFVQALSASIRPNSAKCPRTEH
jgi:hypothetical protein